MWCRRRMEKISWTDRAQKWRSITWSEGRKEHPTYEKTKEGWLVWSQLLRQLLKHVTEGKIERRGRWARRRKQLLDDIKEKRRYWDLKHDALDRTLWRIRLGKEYEPRARNNDNEYSIRTLVSSVLLYCWIGPENHRTIIGISFVIHVFSYDSLFLP